MVQAEIEAVVEMFTAEKEEQLLSGSPDFVLDAIDNIDTKVPFNFQGHKQLSYPSRLSGRLLIRHVARPQLTQAALIAGCKRRGIRVLACAGAGAKADPTRLRVVDISEASIDPLSKTVRQK